MYMASIVNIFQFVPLFLIGLLCTPVYAQPPQWGIAEFYGQSPWASVHRDSRNSDHTPLVTLPQLKVSWSVLDGAALINPGIIGPSGLHYVTSGRGKGFSHLHAFDEQGRMVWESPPEQSDRDLDSLAAFNSPVVDPQGDIYIGDSNQFWAFHADGSLKWVSALPTPGSPFVYQIISRQGYVGGITSTGEVLFYRAQDGSPALPPFQLPAGEADASGPRFPGLWSGGLFDAKAAEISKQIAFGYQVQVANAPAVHPQTGRLYITAAAPKQSGSYMGALYGLDVLDDRVEIAFSVPMGGGSGTSPALSPSADLVYAADGSGNMLGVDADSGEVRWRARGEGLLSPAIGSDGTLYTGDIFNAPTVVALDGATGAQRWARSYDDYAASQLPELAPAPPLVPSGKPIARLVSVISVSANHVWVGMELGYNTVPVSGPKLVIPHKTAICALAPENGNLLGCTLVRDSVEGMIKIGSAGRLYVSHTAIFSSTFYYGLNEQLPQRFRAPRPSGGLTALTPVSFCAQLSAESDRIRQLSEQLAQSGPDTAKQIALMLRWQLEGLPDTLRLAAKENALSEDNGAERFLTALETLTTALGRQLREGPDRTEPTTAPPPLATDFLQAMQHWACPASDRPTSHSVK